MTDGRIQPDGASVVFDHPALEGITCQVQHSVGSGKPHSTEPGTVGVGVVTLPTGQPRLVMQIKHADGTSMACIMMAAECMTIVDCISDAAILAQQIATGADRAVRQ